MLIARCSLVLSRYLSILFIALGRCFILQPVSTQSWCMWLLADQPVLVCPSVGSQKRTLLMSLSLLLQEYPTWLVHLTWIVCEMCSKWPYSDCFMGCYFHNLFKTAHKIVVWFPSSFFSMHFITVQVVHPYSSNDTATAWKKSCFIFIREIKFSYGK